LAFESKGPQNITNILKPKFYKFGVGGLGYSKTSKKQKNVFNTVFEFGGSVL